MSGYFFEGSKSGGFTIQPWMSQSSTDLYQISSTSPSVTPASTSSFTRVSCMRLPPSSRSKETTSPGPCGSVSVPIAFPSSVKELRLRRWLPLVTWVTPPSTDAKCRLRVPSRFTLK